MRHGKGILHFANGDRYEGDFVEDHMKGEGICYLAETGDRYEGQWYNDKKNGYGTYFTSNNGDR